MCDSDIFGHVCSMSPEEHEKARASILKNRVKTIETPFMDIHIILHEGFDNLEDQGDIIDWDQLKRRELKPCR